MARGQVIAFKSLHGHPPVCTFPATEKELLGQALALAGDLQRLLEHTPEFTRLARRPGQWDQPKPS